MYTCQLKLNPEDSNTISTHRPHYHTNREQYFIYQKLRFLRDAEKL